jgi:osmotically-inducible protein OsmY
MKKAFASLTVVLVLTAFGCSNWNRYTPKQMDSTAIADEIRKNMAGDGITGMTVNVDKDGVTTLKGDVKTTTDRQKAIDDARKVNGVTRVIDEISIKP